MRTLSYVVLTVLLILYTVMDLRHRRIWWPGAAAVCAAGLFLHAVLPGQSAAQSLTGMLIGGIMLLIGAATGGAIGSGDSVTLAACGAWLGFYTTFQLLLCALCLTSVRAVSLLLKGKSRHTQLPFMPYLLAAELILWVSGAG